MGLLRRGIASWKKIMYKRITETNVGSLIKELSRGVGILAKLFLIISVLLLSLMISLKVVQKVKAK